MNVKTFMVKSEDVFKVKYFLPYKEIVVYYFLKKLRGK